MLTGSLSKQEDNQVIQAQTAQKALEDAYQRLKQSLLAAGAVGHCRVEPMEIGLRRISVQRRALQQLVKAHDWLLPLDEAQPEEKAEQDTK